MYVQLDKVFGGFQVGNKTNMPDRVAMVLIRKGYAHAVPAKQEKVLKERKRKNGESDR